MATKKQTFKIGDKINYEQLRKAEMRRLIKEDYIKEQNELNKEHQDFINAEEWRKHISWKKVYSELVGVQIDNDEDKYEVCELKQYALKTFDIKDCQENLDALFKYHPLLNTFRYNTFTKKSEFDGERYDEDTKPSEIFNFFKRNFDWCPRIDIKETIQETLNNNEYNPIIEYLESIVWDGTERLETFLIDYYNAEDTKLNRVYFKRWMIAGIKRIFNPGAKFDSMLILSGEQGKKKTSLFNWLGKINDINYCCEVPDNLKDVQGLVYSTLGKLIMTFDDFDDICNKGDLGKIKSFITMQSFNTALKWQHDKEFPVTYILGASTNESSILVDDGAFDERRFWIVNAHADDDLDLFNNEMMDEIKNQLYAEAYYLYKSEPEQKLWIWESDLKKEEINLQKLYKKAAFDPISEKIMSIFNRKYPIINGMFDSFKHFKKCMEDYNDVYNTEIKDSDLINANCEANNDLIESSWDYVKSIPSNWIIELFALGKRSTDRIIQILHTQGLDIIKQERVRIYGCQMTLITVNDDKNYI